MNKKFEEQKFAFVLYINNNIICERYFHIRDYNENVVNSTELDELMDNIVGVNNGAYGSMGIIPKHLKKLSIDYLWSQYNPYVPQEFVQVKNNYEKIDTFTFDIKVGKVSVAKRSFSGNLFPTKVRYQVDIKEIIPSILSEIRYFFSLNLYTHKYLQYEQ